MAMDTEDVRCETDRGGSRHADKCIVIQEVGDKWTRDVSNCRKVYAKKIDWRNNENYEGRDVVTCFEKSETGELIKREEQVIVPGWEGDIAHFGVGGADRIVVVKTLDGPSKFYIHVEWNV
jgi:hypothetical protein